MTDDEWTERYEAIRLLAYAYRVEGRDPRVIGHSEYWSLPEERRSSRDFLVVQDDTYERFLDL